MRSMIQTSVSEMKNNDGCRQEDMWKCVQVYAETIVTTVNNVLVVTGSKLTLQRADTSPPAQTEGDKTSGSRI